MNESRISVRYARALFMSALEKNELDRINSDMIVVRDTCNIPEVREILDNPVIMPSRKIKIFQGLFGKELHELTLSLIDLVVRNGREQYLPAIARMFNQQTKRHKGITESVLTTAVPVDPQTSKQVEDMIADMFKTKVDMKTNVDESIIGGFVLKVEDNFIDASVKNKLRKIKRELLSGSL
ncbi:MAG: ATP synthase F1 subunit delta [Bacteroidales bacterium]|nr:ATP synthase F1 subunit delta [Bacteroidales bacterium]